MPFNNPRTHEYLLQGIAWSRTAEELDRLELFARAHFTGAALAALQAAFGQRRRVLREAPARTRTNTPERVASALGDPLERMMDEIVAATSAAEIEHLRRDVEALFDDRRREQLHRALEGKGRVLGRQTGT